MLIFLNYLASFGELANSFVVLGSCDQGGHVTITKMAAPMDSASWGYRICFHLLLSSC